MDENLAEWYRTAGIEPGEGLSKRVKAIDSFSVGRDETIAAAKLFYGITATSSEFATKFRTHIQKHDTSFKSKGNDHELAILSGALLISVIKSKDKRGAGLAALALVVPAAQNLRSAPPVPEITELAAKSISNWRQETYASEKSFAAMSTHITDKFLAEMKGYCEASDVVNLDKSLQKIASEIVRTQWEANRIARKVALQTEETNILWWLFSNCSRDFQKHFKDFEVAPLSLIVGKELSDLTSQIPGPPAIRAFLDKALRSERPEQIPEEITIEAAIRGTDLAWRQKLVATMSEESIITLSPILSAAKSSLTVAEGENWLPVYKHATGLDANTAIHPVSLAHQIYAEGLLYRAWSESA